ncbi:MAG: UDP-4-amino-4,6-dideoxy-N-acetyl-beta-L-altrosamine transaminase [Pirellulaceae bacterium]
MLPYSRQSIDQSDIDAVVAALKSDWLTTGPAVAEFERAFAESVGTHCAVSFCNGTAALHAAMFALGIGTNDEVIVPAMTFVATANCVLYQGGVPVFADVDPDTLLININDVERKITPRTKAIIAVDYAGQPADYRRLAVLAQKYGLAVVADACHSLGGSEKGVPVGSLADLTCFSMHPVKPITTAEGGMVTTNSTDLAQCLRRFRNHGIERDFRQREASGGYAYGMTDLGFNFRLSDLHAALGLSQLRKLRQFTERRTGIARLYRERLAPYAGIIDPLDLRDATVSSGHLFVVRCRTSAKANRDQIFRSLREMGIGVNVHYLPVYLHPYYREQFGHTEGLCPNAEAAYQEILSLPIYPDMEDVDVDYVCRELTSAAMSTQARAAA